MADVCTCTCMSVSAIALNIHEHIYMCFSLEVGRESSHGAKELSPLFLNARCLNGSVFAYFIPEALGRH